MPTAEAAAEMLIAGYCEAWSEPDTERRQQRLERVWAENGSYTDPGVHVEGRAALSAHIGEVLAKHPGARVEMTSAVDIHHRLARFAWRMVLADGTALPEGLDIAEIGPDGRLLRIVGFFGPLKPIKS